MSNVILDLGEYGSILVESSEDGWTEAGVGETIHAQLDKVLKMPLTGLSRMLLASLPIERDNDAYRLDEFTFEFELSLSSELGSDAGIVAKIVPGGVFKCTYSWKRR